MAMDEKLTGLENLVELRSLALLDDLVKVRGRKGACLLYTSPSPRDGLLSRMPSSA